MLSVGVVSIISFCAMEIDQILNFLTYYGVKMPTLEQ